MNKIQRPKTIDDFNDRRNCRGSNDDNRKPQDLRERLNRIRKDAVPEKTAKVSDDRLKQDLNNGNQKATRTRSQIQPKEEQPVSTGKAENKSDESNEKASKPIRIRPERLNIHAAIKMSLGLTTRRRVDVSQVKKVEEKKLESERESLKNLVEIENEANQKFEDEKRRKIDVKPAFSSTVFKSKISADAAEFIPSYFRKPQVQSFEEFHPVSIPVFPIQPSKVQNRLDRVRCTPQLQPKVVEIPKSDEIKPKSPQKASPFEGFTQAQLDKIANEALDKLTTDQQAQLIYIAKVPSKYFQEVYEYFVDYFENVQCVPLDMTAVEAFLQSRGVHAEKIKPPTPFQHPNFSFTKIEEPEVHEKRKKNPITIVDPNEEEKRLKTIQDDIEIDREIDIMFRRTA
jgi:hypothetical protein